VKVGSADVNTFQKYPTSRLTAIGLLTVHCSVDVTIFIYECIYGTRLYNLPHFHMLMKVKLLHFAPNSSSNCEHVELALTPRNMLREESKPAA
jgi:hypothetical protein